MTNLMVHHKGGRIDATHHIYGDDIAPNQGYVTLLFGEMQITLHSLTKEAAEELCKEVCVACFMLYAALCREQVKENGKA